MAQGISRFSATVSTLTPYSSNSCASTKITWLPKISIETKKNDLKEKISLLKEIEVKEIEANEFFIFNKKLDKNSPDKIKGDELKFIEKETKGLLK